MKSVSQDAVADAQSAEAEAAKLAREAKHRLQEAADRECQHAQVLHYPFSAAMLGCRPTARRWHAGVRLWLHD